MKKLLFFSVLLALVCMGCANEMPELAQGAQPETPKTNLEYALAYAEELLGQIDPQTRGVSRQPNVQVVCSEATRAGEQDTLLYLVNYSDNMGFALLDAEGKNGGVYAISPKGHLEFSDSIDNPVLGNFFRNVYTASSSDPVVIDTVPGTIIWPDRSVLRITDKSGEFLCDRYAEWTCDDIKGAGPNGSTATVTTAATALAKMLALYQTTNSINGTIINWKDIVNSGSYVKSEVKKLHAALNSQDFLDDRGYGGTGTEDVTRRVRPSVLEAALKKLNLDTINLNYSAGSNLFSTYEECRKMKLVLGSQALVQAGGLPKAPVIAFCQPYEKDENYTWGYFQYWIIDGFIDRARFHENFPVYPGMPTNLPTLYHCVWGMDEYYNGYYAYTTECYIDNNAVEFYTERNPNNGHVAAKDSLNHRGNQYLFPNPGILGGFPNKPKAQP